MFRSFIPIVSTALVAGCAVGGDYREPTAGDLGLPSSYYSQAAVSQEPEDPSIWWKRFDDPVLTWSVAQALYANQDLAQAIARLRQAREATIQADATGLPLVQASASGGRTALRVGRPQNSYSLSADASWEADIFGGIQRSIEAARADEQAAAYDLASVQVATIGEVASTNIQARLAQAQLETARDTLAIADDNLDIAGWRVQAGLVSSLDQEQARAARAQTAATIPSLDQNFANATYRLAVLLGMPPGSVTDILAEPEPIPTGPDTVAVGIPADTLRQRPDVRRAERRLAAATARVGVAEAELLPALRISGSFGLSAPSIGGLMDSIATSLFAQLAQTLFDGGELESRVRAQEAVVDEALAAYRQTVLIALEDVENGLVALEAAKARQAQFAIALEAATNQAILARNQYRTGITDFQTLLEAERALLSARDGMNSSRAEQAQAIVQLYTALGGGWSPTATASTGAIASGSNS